MSQSIPRGIEVLVKKATIDPAFKTLLLDRRAAAAAEIGLELSAAEAAMLSAASPAQLETMIAHTIVPEKHRRAFLGKAAAAMLAAMGVAGVAGVGVAICSMSAGIRTDRGDTEGARPDLPDKDKQNTTGSQPDRPSDVEPPTRTTKRTEP
jgi:hypothetical protein